MFSKLYTVEGLLGKETPGGPLPTTGEVYKTATGLAVPAVADSVLVALVSMVDTVMVSTLGSAAIAAVGITAQPRMIILAAFMAINTGLTAVVARRRGQEDQDGANRVLGQTLTVCAVLSALLSVLGGIYARPLLLFAGAQSDVIDLAVAYFRILMIGIPLNVLTICINGAQRGCGNTKISMKINMTANLVNMCMNYLLIGGNLGFPKLGVAGAAIATVTGNLVGIIMAIISLCGRHERFLRIQLRSMVRLDKKTLAPVVSVGSSAAMEQLFLRIGFLLYVKVIASLGTEVMATHNICTSILQVSFGFCDGMGMSAAALFGQSLGRKRPDLAQIYCKACQRMSMVISSLLFVLFGGFGRYFIYMFSREEQIVELGAKVLLLIAVTAPIQATQFISSSCLRSAGDTRVTAISAMISVGLIRPVLAWVLCYPAGGGLLGAWFSYLFDQLIRMVMYIVRIRHNRWRKMVL